VIEQYEDSWHFTKQELLQLHNRFESMSQNGRVTRHSFRQSMGIMGMKTTACIADSVFDVLDTNGDGIVTFEDYAAYIDTLMYGSDEEKASISFRMLDVKRKGVFNYEEFSGRMYEIWKAWNNMTGAQMNFSEDQMKQLFRSIDVNDDGVVKLEEFIARSGANKNLMFWFEFFNKGLVYSHEIKTGQLSPEATKEIMQRNQMLKRIDNGLERCILLLERDGLPTAFAEQDDLLGSLKLLTGMTHVKSTPKLRAVRHTEATVFDSGLKEHHSQAIFAAVPRKEGDSMDCPRKPSLHGILPEDDEGYDWADEEESDIIDDSEDGIPEDIKSRIDEEDYEHGFSRQGTSFATTESNFEPNGNTDADYDLLDRNGHSVDLLQKSPREFYKSGHDSLGADLAATSARNSGLGHDDISLSDIGDISYVEDASERTDIVLDMMRRLQSMVKNLESKEAPVEESLIEEDGALEDVSYATARRYRTATNVHKKVSRSNSHPNRKEKKMFVDFGHPNWNLVLNMMLGIRTAVKSVFRHKLHEISAEDFSTVSQFALVPQRSSGMEDSIKVCKFHDYAPIVFDKIRELNGVSNDEYLKSVGPEHFIVNILMGNIFSLSELVSSGKSGSFFYYTADGKYMIKTISREEFTFLKKIIPNYYNHVTKNPETLIIRFFGVHKMVFAKKGGRNLTNIRFVIMANIFNTTLEIHQRYDLKGSTYGRQVETEKGGPVDPAIARKDLDLLNSKTKIMLGDDTCSKLLNQIEKDVKFFKENKIIDYSLLLGVHNREYESLKRLSVDEAFTHRRSSTQKPAVSRFYEAFEGGMLSADGSKIYFVGIIDILTEYNVRKKVEHNFKRARFGEGISCVPPIHYGDRFKEFLKGLLISKSEIYAISSGDEDSDSDVNESINQRVADQEVELFKPDIAEGTDQKSQKQNKVPEIKVTTT